MANFSGKPSPLDPNGDGIHEREYRVYRAPGCDPADSDGVPCPLVILLHPASHTGFGFATKAGKGTTWVEAADENRLVLAAPNAEFENNEMKYWSNGLFQGVRRIELVDEVGFLNQMVAEIRDSGFAHIDPDSQGVWIHGGSSGGYLTHSLAGVFNGAFDYRIRGIATSISSYGGHTETPYYNDPDNPEHSYEAGTLCWQVSAWQQEFDLLNPIPGYPIPALIMMGKFDQKVRDEGGSNEGCYEDDPALPSGCHDDRQLTYMRDLRENAEHYAGVLAESAATINDCSGTPDSVVDPGGQKQVFTYRRDGAGVEYGETDPAGRTSGCKAVVQAVLLSCGVPFDPFCPSGQRWVHHSFPNTTQQSLVWDTTSRIVAFWREYAGLP